MRSGVLVWGAAIALAACGIAHSADLDPVAKLPPALWSWTGGYIGVHGGGGYGRTSFSDPYGPSIYGDIVSTPAFLAGGQVGYNWQTDRWVIGAELDASHAVSDGTNSCLAFSGAVVIATCKVSPDVFVTGTARVGYALGLRGQTFGYIKAGVAWQHNRGNIANNNEFDGRFAGFPQHTMHFDYGRLGWTVGVGLEQALTPAWSVKFEYDYMGFDGTHQATPPTVQFPPPAIIAASTTSLSSNYHIGKIGLNYHFGGDASGTEWFDASVYPGRAAAKTIKPVFDTGGWSFEGGSRVWLSRGTFQWDYTNPPPISGDSGIPNSRLTYHGLDGISGELFARLDSPWGIFLKGNVGVGRFNKGRMNDEDSSTGSTAYSNTLSDQANGRFMYYTADVGYDFMRGSTYKLGAFIGGTYFGQKSDSIACVQTASPYGACAVPVRQIIGSQDANWDALRVGLNAETMLFEDWRLSADVAYLPWTDFTGRDNHLLRPETTFYDQRGQGGGGVQIEGTLSYFLSRNFSIGVGARYWAMWTKNDSDVIFNCSGCSGRGTLIQIPALAKYSMERWGTFFEASYKFE
ncbi:outer membrane protein [Bradyrhizobium sp. CCBAU 51753]|uniref:outer membrane protein n=1 Tax=Bradyrhizobium sp. CCBAU 51753 TaxID=1325100 RepID=UPI00188D4D7E|nr:outer membrane beta-barrel protein [Bradyrhizobium sp. CCBAU 51753]QOZ23770.1 hypothetical protein XH93_09160 [Bradyrhizobium sp. CCBAU 51753]